MSSRSPFVIRTPDLLYIRMSDPLAIRPGLKQFHFFALGEMLAPLSNSTDHEARWNLSAILLII